MRRGKNVVTTYGKHRQRRIASDPWSCVESSSQDVFSTSNSDGSLLEEESAKPSVQTRSSRTTNTWNKINNTSGHQQTSESSSGSSGIFGSGKTFSRRILQLSNKGNNTSDEFQQTQKKPSKSARKNPRRTNQTRNRRRAKENNAPIPERDLSKYDFSDIERYSLIISDSPLAGGGDKITCEQLCTPLRQADCLSSTPNIGQHPSLRKYSLGSCTSAVKPSPQGRGDQICDAASPTNVNNRLEVSACQHDLDKLHISSIAGSPASELEQSKYHEDCSNLSTCDKSYSGKLTSSKCDSFSQAEESSKCHDDSSVNIIEPSPMPDCPARNLRSAKKSKKWYHQVFPTCNRIPTKEIHELDVSSELDSNIIEPTPQDCPARNLRSTKKSKSNRWYHQMVPYTRNLHKQIEQDFNSSSELESVGALNITYRLDKKKKKPTASGSLHVMLDGLGLEDQQGTSKSNNKKSSQQVLEESQSYVELENTGKSEEEDTESDEVTSDEDEEMEESGLEKIEESVEEEYECEDEEGSAESDEECSEEEEVKIGSNRSSDVTRYMLTSILEEEDEEEDEEDENDDGQAEESYEDSEEIFSNESNRQSSQEKSKGTSLLEEDTSTSPATTSYYTADGTAMSTPRPSRNIHSTPFKEALTPGRCRKSGLMLSARDKVLQQCNQTQPISFNECIPPSMMAKCVKIGEGVYGEVFRSERRNQSVALKIIPIEGDFLVNDEQQKKFDEILPEIVISRELSALSEGQDNCTPNFVQVKGVSLVQGSYPQKLLDCWEAYHKSRGSQNDHPEMFPDDQLFVIFEFADSGYDLESVQFTDSMRAKAVLQQVALSLAVAEQELQFEHRDLHWGNVLVKTTKEEYMTYVINGQEFSLPSNGVQVAIIDFTMSRLSKDGCAVFCDLSVDETLFLGEGDYQFDVYRQMKEENGNDWKTFHPFTNVLWLHYLCDKLRGKTYKSTSKEHQSCMREFRTLHRELLDYSSATHVIEETQFFEPEQHELES